MYGSRRYLGLSVAGASNMYVYGFSSAIWMAQLIFSLLLCVDEKDGCVFMSAMGNIGKTLICLSWDMCYFCKIICLMLSYGRSSIS